MNSIEQIKQHLLEHQYTWLITGVAGFIGSNLLEQLLALNQRVIGLDNFFSGKRVNIENITGLNKANFIFHETDILDQKASSKIFNENKIDFVLHQAALASVPLSIKDPKFTCEVNINGFVNILDLAKNHQVKSFVYASSSAVYGDNIDPVKIESRLGNLLSPYAMTKYTNELIANQYSDYYNIPTIGLRYFNIFGKRQDPNSTYAAVIPKWIQQMLSNQQISIYGDGTTTRDFCSVNDVVSANILACFNQSYSTQSHHKAFNIGVGQDLSLNKLYAVIIELAKKHNIVYQHDVLYEDFIKGDIKHSCANIDLARKYLNFHPGSNFYDELDNVFTWVLNYGQ